MSYDLIEAMTNVVANGLTVSHENGKNVSRRGGEVVQESHGGCASFATAAAAVLDFLSYLPE